MNTKKVRHLLCKGRSIKFRCILEHQKQFRTQLMCRVLEVSRAGFYAWCTRTESKRSITDKALLSHIKTICADSRNTYGYRRVHAALTHGNERWSQFKVLRLMRENKIYPKMRKKFKVTTDSKHNKAIHENRLSRQFKVQEPNQCWVSDVPRFQ